MHCVSNHHPAAGGVPGWLAQGREEQALSRALGTHLWGQPCRRRAFYVQSQEPVSSLGLPRAEGARHAGVLASPPSPGVMRSFHNTLSATVCLPVRTLGLRGSRDSPHYPTPGWAQSHAGYSRRVSGALCPWPFRGGCDRLDVAVPWDATDPRRPELWCFNGNLSTCLNQTPNFILTWCLVLDLF